MEPKNILNAEEREFFSYVNDAVLTNPFRNRRLILDKKIAQFFPYKPKMDTTKRAIYNMDKRIKILEKKNKANLIYFFGKDREHIANAFLFEFFYKFKDKFDKLIIDQIKAGDTPIKVPFADDAINHLHRRGFGVRTSLRYMSLSYQFRRAFFFIGHSLIGPSSAMKKLRQDLWNNIFTHNVRLYDQYLWNRMEDFSTMILGETGTGKGTAAMAIGRSGYIPFDRKKQCFVESFTRSFVSLNLSQFPESLLESELFGHKKGAFTGAVEDYKGVFERCSPYGAMLLDEIGEVSIPVQIKLLQVLQERVFSPVGSHQKSRFQGRVIAATSRNINEIRKKGIFRDDFYYRLCSETITVPRLKKRLQDDPKELDKLLNFTVEKMIGKPTPKIAEMIKEVIEKKLGKNYHWPGNVRELEQCVRSVMISKNYEGDKIYFTNDPNLQIIEGINTGNIDAQKLLSGYCSLLYQRHKTFEEVSRRTDLDRRTVKKYIMEWNKK